MMHVLKYFISTVLLLLIFYTPTQADDGSYQTPNQQIKEILEWPGLPGQQLSPGADYLLLMHRPPMLDLEDIARPRKHLAGYRIDPVTNGPALARTAPVNALTFVPTDGSDPIEVNLPDDARLNDIRFTPGGGEYLTFTHTDDSGIHLWKVETGTPEAMQVSDRPLNAAGGSPCSFIDESNLLCEFIPPDRGSAPDRPDVPEGPSTQDADDRATPVRTFRDLLKDEHDEDLYEYYFTSQLKELNIEDGSTELIGEPAIFDRLSLSPDREHIFVSRTVRPYSFIVPDWWRRNDWFPREMEIWNREGEKTHHVASMPLAEDVAVYHVRNGPRDPHWQRGEDATLVWAENAEDEDDYSEHFYRLPYPFDEAERLISLEDRYWNTRWLNDGRALVTEVDRYPYRAASWTRTWVIHPDDETHEAYTLFDRSTEDDFTDPGSPIGRQDGDWIYLRGDGLSPEGERPFIDRIHLETQQTERVWESPDGSYEYPLRVLGNPEDGYRFLLRSETREDPPAYVLKDQNSGNRNQLTDLEDPVPEIRDVERIALTYEREDGVELSGTVYLPPGYDGEERLPVMLWAYPREFVDADAAGQIAEEDHRFMNLSGPTHLFFLLRGYAIFDGPSIAILGGEHANDTYVEQLVKSAEAAVDAIVDEGIADPDRIGVGGHSYGGFMTANLLAHTDLFSAGIARSAAFNRTLTPFGFQNELRTLWEATDVYTAMSPYMNVHKIDAPMLMIHGADDPNPGTFPMQTERMFHAMQGLGKEARKVMLPFEDHGYGARESIHHTLYEMFKWMDSHVKENE